MIEGSLEALIIDDSPTDAQMLSYLLTKRLSCRVDMVEDGIQGLDRLSSRKFDLVFLDLVMPLMSGLEVLREIRGYPATADIPVVIISGVADPSTVRELLNLKLLDYIIKPYHAEIIVKRLSEKLAALRASRSVPISVKLSAGECARDDSRAAILIADGDANFRHFCSETLGHRYQILEAPNGGQAIALAVKFAPEFMIVGSDLGPFDRDRMVAKIRQLPGITNTKVLAVTSEGQDVGESSRLYDGFVRRTFVADAFVAATERWLTPSNVDQLKRDSFEYLRAALVSATEQVFGMMMSAEVCVDEKPPPPDELGSPATYGTIRLASFADLRRATITFYAARDSVTAMSTRMLREGKVSAEAADLAHSSLAEILNIIAGRVNNSLSEHGREFCIGFPTIEEKTTADDEPKAGFTIGFTAAQDIHFSIRLVVDRLPKSRIPPAGLKEAMVLAESIDLPNGAKLLKGLRLNREHITAIEKAHVDDVEIFDSF